MVCRSIAVSWRKYRDRFAQCAVLHGSCSGAPHLAAELTHEIRRCAAEGKYTVPPLPPDFAVRPADRLAKPRVGDNSSADRKADAKAIDNNSSSSDASGNNSAKLVPAAQSDRPDCAWTGASIVSVLHVFADRFVSREHYLEKGLAATRCKVML